MNVLTPQPSEVMMWSVKPEEQPALPPYLTYAGVDRLLSPPECREIIRAAEQKEMGPGTVGNGHNGAAHEDQSYRSVQTTGLHANDTHEGQDLKWLYARIIQRIAWANQAYRFHLSGCYETINYLQYDVAPDRQPGHYKMHQDFGGGHSSLRKLSAVIQLSDPSEYTGCRLHLITHEDAEIAEIGQGDMVVFPSWTPHYVTPIESGTRRALALWVSGPQFV